MATADITLTQFQAELGEAKTALAAGDVDTARKKSALAQITLSGLLSSQNAAGRSYQLQQDQLGALERAIDLYERVLRTGRSPFTKGIPV